MQNAERQRAYHDHIAGSDADIKPQADRPKQHAASHHRGENILLHAGLFK